MARVRMCGVCMQPAAACICDDEEPGEPQGGSEEGDAA